MSGCCVLSWVGDIIGAPVDSRDGKQALKGDLVLLDNVLGDAWRSVLVPRQLTNGDTPVAVSIAAAIRAGAIVLWRTHVDEMPDEARTITAVGACLATEQKCGRSVSGTWRGVGSDVCCTGSSASEMRRL